MADRQFNQFQLSLMKRRVTLHPIVSVGANGAVTLKKWQYSSPGAGGVGTSVSLVSAPTSGVGYAYGDGQGVRSVVRNGTGDWTFTLSDSYRQLISCSFVVTNSSGTITVPDCCIKSGGTNVTTNTAVGNGGTIELIFSVNGGSATDPGNGDQLNFEIVLADATEL